MLVLPTTDKEPNDNESEALVTWTESWSVPFVEHVSKSAFDLIIDLSECLDTIHDYDDNDPESLKYVFESIEGFFAYYLTSHFPHLAPPFADHKDWEKMVASRTLFDSGFLPIYDGVVWRLHNRHRIVTTGLRMKKNQKMDS